MQAKKVLAVCSSVLTVACGDPIVGDAFLGTAVFEVRGDIQQSAPAERSHDPENLRLSLFWIGFDSREMQRPVSEQRTVVDNAFASFTMTLFDPPGREALEFSDLAEATDLGLGLALIVLYADNNDNGALNSYEPVAEGPDIVLGASPSHMVAYAAGALPEGSRAAALLGPIGPGYHLFESTREGRCVFTSAESCVGEGGLMRVDPASATVILALEPTPEEVRVPSPELGGGTSSSVPGNVYSGR